MTAPIPILRQRAFSSATELRRTASLPLRPQPDHPIDKKLSSSAGSIEQNIQVLFTHCNSRIIAFTTAVKPGELLPWTSPSERTLASGECSILETRTTNQQLQAQYGYTLPLPTISPFYNQGLLSNHYFPKHNAGMLTGGVHFAFNYDRAVTGELKSWGLFCVLNPWPNLTTIVSTLKESPSVSNSEESCQKLLPSKLQHVRLSVQLTALRLPNRRPLCYQSKCGDDRLCANGKPSCSGTVRQAPNYPASSNLRMKRMRLMRRATTLSIPINPNQSPNYTTQYRSQIDGTISDY